MRKFPPPQTAKPKISTLLTPASASRCHNSSFQTGANLSLTFSLFSFAATMPSLTLSDSDSTPQQHKKDNTKNKKCNNIQSSAEPEGFIITGKKSKKEKKSSDGVLCKKEKSKKRKASSHLEVMMTKADGEDENGFELVEPRGSREEKKKKKKKVKLEESLLMEEEVVVKKEDPNAVSKFRISGPLREMLKEKGIVSLFPIQAMTFDTVLDGSDLVGRARTGQVCLSSLPIIIIIIIISTASSELFLLMLGVVT